MFINNIQMKTVMSDLISFPGRIIKQPYQKVGKRGEQKFSQSRHRYLKNALHLWSSWKRKYKTTVKSPRIKITSFSADVGQRILHHFWWECWVVQPFKNSLDTSKKLEIDLKDDPDIMLLGNYSKNTNGSQHWLYIKIHLMGCR